jgi:outer membrane immunogenic protein
MFMRSLALGAIAVLPLALVANADGEGGGTASWGGYYIGLHAGQGSADTDTDRVITNNTYFGATNLIAVEDESAMSLDEDTFTGGGQLGMNWPAGAFVFGFEVDASGYGNDTSGSSTLVYPTDAPDTFTVTNSLEQTWLATARLRLGVGNDWFLAYATGGYAGGDITFTQTFSDTFTPFPTQIVENSEFRSGYSVGGGIEVMIESGASIKVEYLYLDLGDIQANGPIASGTTTSNGTAEITDQIIRLGVNFQMN